MTRSATARPAKGHRAPLLIPAVIVLGLGLVLFSAFVLDGSGEGAAADGGLPNPMGGPALAAPGTISGATTLGGLQVSGTEITMGEVALGVTYVSGWELTNPTEGDLSVAVGQPRVLEGCCPGPVYADGELTQAGQRLVVPAGERVLLQFPLQMHPGMDGPHHLAVPLSSDGQEVAVHVTGDFTADAA